ncbi:hypothetical protein OG552_11020 [Streptomyces sp. NBC_01476]|uniref:hypothetical protein n=1 Tax=Streptomyces sp. NBC_01476 TaxID=2903881 RepID=UPI002E358EDC|nr:hypothetical protein [Streptomyces sp. NBC_01476]
MSTQPVGFVEGDVVCVGVVLAVCVGRTVGWVVCGCADAEVAGGAAVVGADVAGRSVEAEGDAEAEADFDGVFVPGVVEDRPASSGAGVSERELGGGGRSCTPEPGAGVPPEAPEKAARENIVSAPTTATAPTP